VRVRRWRRVPGPLLVAWCHPYCFLTTPLLDAEEPEAALTTLLARATSEPRVLGVMLDLIDAAGFVGDALAAVVAPRDSLQIDGFERALLRRRPENDYLVASVSVKHEKELRRLRRRLEGEIGTIESRDRAGESDAVERFLELELSGWKGRAGTAMGSDIDHARFFREMCEGFAGTGRLQLLTLEHDGDIVAMKCNLMAGDGIYCFKIAFDERFAKYSPGIHLEVANVDHFHDRTGAAWMDSCAVPQNAMINRLWRDRRLLQSVLIRPSGIRGTLGSSLWRSARAARSAVDHRRKKVS